MPSPEETDTLKTDDISICAFDNCSEQNIHKCRKCTRSFCIMHCNTFSPNFCKDCFKNLSIISDKFKRTFDHIAENGQMYVQTEERLRYYLDGPDWPFVTPWIDSLSDEELRSIWVFHHYIMKLIEVENDTRKVERTRQLANTPIPRLITTTKTKSVTKVITQETPDDLRKKWKKMNIPDATIEQMILAMGVKP
jgi:hypothetical protein